MLVFIIFIYLEYCIQIYLILRENNIRAQEAPVETHSQQYELCTQNLIVQGVSCTDREHNPMLAKIVKISRGG